MQPSGETAKDKVKGESPEKEGLDRLFTFVAKKTVPPTREQTKMGERTPIKEPMKLEASPKDPKSGTKHEESKKVVEEEEAPMTQVKLRKEQVYGAYTPSNRQKSLNVTWKNLE